MVEIEIKEYIFQLMSDCHVIVSSQSHLNIAALAHLGERQTEAHFMSPFAFERFLEVLCSIHRSGIYSFELVLFLHTSRVPTNWHLRIHAFSLFRST
jgi:hypothetical protein